ISILVVLVVGAIAYQLAVPPGTLSPQQSSPESPALLPDAQFVPPGGRLICATGQLDVDLDLGVASGCQASEFRYPTSVFHRFLQAPALLLGDVAEEAEHIQEVRLA